MISYTDAVQIILAVYLVAGLGYMCGGTKMFGVKEASAIRRIVYKIAMPALLFHQIGMRTLTLNDWHPFLNELLVQATVHLLFAAFSFALPFKDKRLTYLQSLFACTYTNFIFVGYPVIQVLFGEDQTYIPSMMNIVQFVFVVPLHTFLIYGTPTDTNSDAPHTSDHHSHCEEEGEMELEDKGHAITPVEGVADVTCEEEEEEDRESHTDEPQPQRETTSRWKTVMGNTITPMNVCIVLGIIWSATVWDFPLFLDTFLLDLEKAVMGAGMFSIGVLLWEHPFARFNIPVAVLYMVLHFVVIPLISALWAWVVGMDNRTARICTFAHAMPPGLIGYIMSVNCGYGMKTASFTFYWSSLLCIFVLMIWVAVFNTTGLFEDQDL